LVPCWNEIMNTITVNSSTCSFPFLQCYERNKHTSKINKNIGTLLKWNLEYHYCKFKYMFISFSQIFRIEMRDYVGIHIICREFLWNYVLQLFFSSPYVELGMRWGCHNMTWNSLNSNYLDQSPLLPQCIQLHYLRDNLSREVVFSYTTRPFLYQSSQPWEKKKSKHNVQKGWEAKHALGI